MQRRRICYQPRFGLGWIQLRHSGLAATITGNRSRRRTQATTTWQQQTEGATNQHRTCAQDCLRHVQCDFNLRTTIHHRKNRIFFNWIREYSLATHVLQAATYTPVNSSLNHLATHTYSDDTDQKKVGQFRSNTYKGKFMIFKYPKSCSAKRSSTVRHFD